jgi:hypothetical protein
VSEGIGLAASYTPDGFIRPDSVTIGDFETEVDSCVALDDALQQAGLWRIYREVPGTLLQARPAQQVGRLRIDRILTPTNALIDMGWRHGVVGIEAKRSGIKIGPPIAQAMDYTRAAWTLPPYEVKVLLDWVFIWPMSAQSGTIASILAQHRIGCAKADRWTLLHLKTGEENLIKIGRDGTIEIGAGANGRKAGSR